MDQLKQNLERILKVRDVDLGLFILAMHSLIERCLSEKYGTGNYDSDNTFGTLLGRYINDYYNTRGKPGFPCAEKRILSNAEWNLFQSLKKLYKNHHLSNDVRHRFDTKNIEEAQATVKCFLSFAEAENWKFHELLNKLKRELETWDSHSSYQSEELTKAIALIKQLKAENENLAEKVNTFEDLQNQLNVLTSKENLLKTQLQETEARLSKKDAKVDELRKKTHDQMMSFQNEKKEILEQLKEYESTKEYISHLEKVAFYTKTRHDYESSVTKLTTEQTEVLEQIKLNKDYLVKTLEKAVESLKSDLNFETIKNHFRLLTYTKSLVKYNQYVTKILGTEIPEETITTADSFLFSMMKKFYPAKDISFGFEDSFDAIFVCEKFSAKEVFIECQEFIWANCITKEVYVEKVCDRIGMKNPMKKDERIAMWSALENIENQLETHDKW